VIDLPATRQAYRLEFSTYQRLAVWAADHLRAPLRAVGVYQPEVSGRPKDVPSFVKKALRGSYVDPIAEITDKAGVRVIVSLLDDVGLVERVVQEQFLVIEHQNKGDQLDPDRLGYLGVHFLATPRVQDLTESNEDLEGKVFEVQIHTRAQNAWAMVSHPLLYKSAGLGAPPALRRRINRLVALVELFDLEVAAARKAMIEDPMYPQATMLQQLEREFLQMTDRDYDPVLSLAVLAAIAAAYEPEELARFDDLVKEFMADHREYLAAILDNSKNNEDANPLLFQPEVIAILERLENRKELLRVAWDQSLSPKLLDSLSEELGRPA